MSTQMANETLKKQLKATKRELLAKKHSTELEIISNKKELRRTKRKIKEVDKVLEQI